MQKSKKILALLLILVLCFSAVPISALTVSAETVKIGYISGEDVNIRKDATTSSEKVATVSKWTVTVLKSKNDTLGTINPNTEKVYEWYQITYTSQSKTIKGYIREDLIEVKSYELDASFSETLKNFPESYHNYLTVLHALYPNWEFTADKVESSFSDAVAAQDTDFKKLVTTNYNSLRSMREGCYDWEKEEFITSDNGKYGASKEVIAYYMDPRNFLNANDIYIFMQQSYDAETQTKDGVKQIIEGTYLDAKITDKNDKYYGKTYATVIIKAAQKSKVNPYVLASTLIQEQGSKGSVLSKGGKYNDTTVYNFFNFGASGSTKEEVIKNGQKYAYNQGWTTPSAALIEGAVKYGSNYIAIGQDTYFYKNYNVLNPDKLWHQYAQSVHDSLSSSRFLKTNYADYKDLKVTFRIPVYEDMPTKVSKFPTESDELNNYYFSSIKVDGLTPAFNMYTTSYTLTATGDIDVYIGLPENALYTSSQTYNLKKGTNTVKLKVKSQTGYSRTYTITVTAEKSAVLTVKQLGGTLIQEDDGRYYYYLNGEKSTETTLVKYNGKYHYVKKGVFTESTTFVKYLNKYYYVENGIWTKDTKFVKYKDKYYYVKSGIRSTDTKFVKYEGKYYYIKKGVRSSDTKFVKYNNEYYYIKKGIRSDKTGFVKYKDKYYRLKEGVRVSKDTYTKYGSLYLRLSTTEFTYSGKARRPSVKIYNSKGNKLSTDYYTVSYASGRKNVGKYKVTVNFKGKYSGSVKLYFKITPEETIISKVTAAKKSLKVKIKKQSTQTKGYEIQYSTSKTFENAKTKTIKNHKTTTVTLKKLKSNKTYYIRVRTYKTVNGKKYYSDWSNYKKKKTK